MTVLSDHVIKKCIDHEEEINIKLNPKICCPELVGTNLTVDAACANDKCGKSVATREASQYLKQDVMKLYQRDGKMLKDMLYFLENIDYTYNSKSNIITKMSDHLS